MTASPILDFYKKHNISPVSNTINHKFYEKREALFYHLGILPSWVEGKSVVDFGPGNGIYSLYTQSLKPARHALVDGNPKALENCKKHFEENFSGDKTYELYHSLIEDFPMDSTYDLVICEGVIPHHEDPVFLTRHVGKYLKKGGVLFISCHDHIATFSESLRAFFGFLIVKNIKNFQDKVNELEALYKNHFEILDAMDRDHSDWVTDNILNEAFWKDASWLSIEDAICALEKDFAFYNSSPNFMVDWSWFKRLDGSDLSYYKNKAIDQYHPQLHNFLDCRYEFAPRDPKDNLELLERAKKITKFISKTDAEDHLKDFVEFLSEIKLMIEEFSPQTAKSLQDYIRVRDVFEKEGAVIDFGDFKNFWGRGNQLVSFVKNRMN